MVCVLNVLKRSILKPLPVAFDMRLRSKTRRSKMRVLEKRVQMESPERGCDVGPCVV